MVVESTWAYEALNLSQYIMSYDCLAYLFPYIEEYFFVSFYNKNTFVVHLNRFVNKNLLKYVAMQIGVDGSMSIGERENEFWDR